MSRGGPRPGAGRPKGSLNKRSAELLERAKESGDELPVDFLLRVQRNDKEDMRLRIEAAKAAAPFLHAKLSVKEETQFEDRDFLDPSELAGSLASLFEQNPQLYEQLMKLKAGEKP